LGHRRKAMKLEHQMVIKISDQFTVGGGRQMDTVEIKRNRDLSEKRQRK